MKTAIRLTALALVPLLFSACGPKRQPGGLLDDPRTHSDRAKQYYDAGDNDRARQEYTLALELDKKFAPALAGLGMLEARLHNWDAAEKDIKKAIDQDDKIPDGRMAWGVYLGEKYRGKDSDDWLSEAESQFDKAVDRAPKNGEVWYRRGIVRQWALKLREAGDAYRKVLDLDGAYTTVANEAWARIQKIERAAPGTRVGKKIALVDSLTRSDAAALFIAELQLDRILSRSRGPAADTAYKAPVDPRELKAVDAAKPAANDISGHWARNFIEDALKLGIRGLQVGPDGAFRPGQALDRAEFAFLSEDALIAALGDKTLATRYIGSSPRFSDVSAGSPYYNAICDAVDHNVMSPNSDGTFGALQPVSGADALLTIRLIKELRK
jgi:tetratricopeptide (TPR) repeat protein